MTFDVIIPILFVLLSVVGLANAFYFTFAYYGRIKKARWVPEILCAREGSSCVTVVKTQYARVFGWPNSLFGIVYYVALIGWALFPAGWMAAADARVPGFSFLLRILLTAASTVTVILGVYLVYALRKKLHTHCPLCYLAHAVNCVLLLLVILTAW